MHVVFSITGVVGMLCGIPVNVCSDGGDSPPLLNASNLNEYSTPFVSFNISNGDVNPLTNLYSPPSNTEHLYPKMAEPVFSEFSKYKRAELLCMTTFVIIGVPGELGATYGKNGYDIGENPEFPAELTANTRIRYVLLLMSPYK
jgi:hypothetical protein